MGKKQTKVRKLTDTQKAEIALLKETRPTATSTNKNIAMDFDVSTDLVNRISYESLSPEQKAIFNRKRADLKYLAQDLTYNSIVEANNRVLNDKTAKLSEIMGAAKIGSDIFRLEEGSPTAINGTLAPVQAALRFIKECKNKGATTEEALEMLRQLDAEEIDDAAKIEVIGVLSD